MRITIQKAEAIASLATQSHHSKHPIIGDPHPYSGKSPPEKWAEGGSNVNIGCGREAVMKADVPAIVL
jgi:hypothetical protein